MGQTNRITHHMSGFGLGLRPPHYNDFSTGSHGLDWLEIVTDNFLVAGGKPLAMLERVREHTPVVMHGVAMSIGGSAPLDMAYLARVKTLAERIEPLWVSDHLCWTGHGPHHLHDLYPLPYTDAAARHVVARIRRAQDVLQRRLVIENVSSYVTYRDSAAAEWDFLSHVAQEADCLLLLDVNNVYVSSVNHHFDPWDYLRALPAHRIQQIHLAGHTHQGPLAIDTHDQAVPEPVWDLYAQACELFGAVPTMVERDANIPALPELLAEVERARVVRSQNTPTMVCPKPPTPYIPSVVGAKSPAELDTLQGLFAAYVLQPHAGAQTRAAEAVSGEGQVVLQRLAIYHHAYRARLAEVLGDTFSKTRLYMGGELFDTEATAYAEAHPPHSNNLARYGDGWVAHLQGRYPDNTELHELAQLEWDLRTRFDGPDQPAMDAVVAAAQAGSDWVLRPRPLHNSVCVRQLSTNAVQLWRAMDEDLPVPPPLTHQPPVTLVVWRKGLQPHFQTTDPLAGRLLGALLLGLSISDACAALVEEGHLQDPASVGSCLAAWLEMGLLHADPVLEAV